MNGNFPFSRAWSDAQQKHSTFKEVISPLKQNFDINFGFMRVFNNGTYFQMIENLECLKEWVLNVQTSQIFCERNVTTCFDQDYNFSIWPEVPNCIAMEIYKKFNIWNGITISKIEKEFVDIYWFTRANKEPGWHKFFVTNKPILIEFIKYFNSFKSFFCKEEFDYSQNLFWFSKGFESYIPDSDYKTIDIFTFKIFSEMLKNKSFLSGNKILSPRETEVLKIIGRGYTAKVAAKMLDIAVSTVLYHINHIKEKTNTHTKVDLIKLYEGL